jgi:signal peptidase I
LALLTFLSSLALVALVFLVLFRPSSTVLWAILVAFVAASVLWITEQFAVRKLALQPSQPAVLVRGFYLASGVLWLTSGLVAIVIVASFGSFVMKGRGMAPTLEDGERLVFRKAVESDHLRRGKVIVFRVSAKSAWGPPGSLVTARILGAPGDQLSMNGGSYVVNGAPGPEVAATGTYQPVIPVPVAPDFLVVPNQCYFVVQDEPQNSFDSRVLSWAESSDVVTTRLYYLGSRGIFTQVE